MRARNYIPEHAAPTGTLGMAAHSTLERPPPSADYAGAIQPPGRWRLRDYTPGMLASRAVAWWQAKRMAKDSPGLRAGWVERWGGWDNMSRSQKVAVTAIDVGAAVLLVSAIGKASQAAGVDVSEFNPWSGGDAAVPGTAAVQHESQPPAPCAAPEPPPAALPANEHAPPPGNTPALSEVAMASTITNPLTPPGTAEIGQSAATAQGAAIQSRDIGTFTGSINPDTGYYFGTAYNTIAEELIEEGANPKHDIPAPAYHAAVGETLTENGWTWESARRSMQPDDSLEIDRSDFSAYLPPTAEPTPPPAPEPPPPPPLSERDCPEPAVATPGFWLGVGAAALGGVLVGAMLGSHFSQPLREYQRRMRYQGNHRAAPAPVFPLSRKKPPQPPEPAQPIRPVQPTPPSAPAPQPPVLTFHPQTLHPEPAPKTDEETEDEETKRKKEEQKAALKPPRRTLKPTISLTPAQQSQLKKRREPQQAKAPELPPSFTPLIDIRPPAQPTPEPPEETHAEQPPSKPAKGKKRKRRKTKGAPGQSHADIRFPGHSVELHNASFIMVWPRFPESGPPNPPHA